MMYSAQQASLDLFDTPSAVTDSDRDIARSGLAHFQNQMARYASQWPYLVPEWSSWIAYFERLERYGYEAAKIIKPANEESEPSQLCAALTRRRVGPINVN